MNNSTYGKEKKNSKKFEDKKYTTNYCLGEKYIYIGKKKEKANLVIPIEKNQQIRNRLVKRKNAVKLLSYKCKKCSVLSRAK